MIQVLKASAGSGKTYNLALTYIKLLLASSDRYAYRHILAVTFTNKATAEMKDRILRELSRLSADPLKSPYLGELVPAVCKDVQTLRSRCATLLPDILHDYSAFAVSTIDKFFQRTLKAFAREIGYYASYQVELDKDSLIRETVDRLLDSLTEEDPDLLHYLTGAVRMKLEQGHSPRLERDLFDIGKRLKSTEFQYAAMEVGMDSGKAYSKDNVRAVRDCCSAVMDGFVKSVSSASGRLLEALAKAGIGVEDSSRGSLRPLEIWASAVKPGDIKAPTEAFLRNCREPELFFRKSDRGRFAAALGSGFAEAMEDFLKVWKEGYPDFMTASLIYGASGNLGLAREFFKAFEDLVTEKNIMSLDDANAVLKRIIDGSDAPFIYEKTGVRYEHFLLDEFQDTSGVQWENFRPLLQESDSYGRDNLVVGDIKQSIYRWRGSDWHLLSEDLPRQFPSAEQRSLQHNFRSLREIVGFNNGFFTQLAAWMDANLGLEGQGSISAIYSDVVQEPRCRDAAPGYVKVEFVPGGDECDAVLDSIAAARDAGASLRDIAVLVRGHKDGAAVAQALIDAGIPVISDDSLMVKSSVTVRRLCSLLSCVDNPQDEISNYLALSMSLEYPSGYHSLVDLCESLLRTLREADRALFEGEVLYIQTFMDIVQDWTMVNGNDLAGFLEYWKDADPKITSPEDSDSVTIMTIHKSKGLQFPYVIFPFAEQVGDRMTSNVHWCRPLVHDGPLAPAGGTLYPVNISSKLYGTAFEDSLRREITDLAVDDINIYYVAFTRAEKVLHVISSAPDDKLAEALRRADAGSCSLLSHYLYMYCFQNGFEYGTMYDFSTMERTGRRGSFEQTLESGYPSIPLVLPSPSPEEDGGAGECSRLKFNADAADFFGPADGSRIDGNPRESGIIKHEILGRIDSLSELRRSVDMSVHGGRLTAEEGEKIYSQLYPAVEQGVAMGWFSSAPDEGLISRNEVSLIDTDASVYRPDRVVIRDGSVSVIDYKFGDARESYIWQVRRYMRLYRQMGYKEVRGWLWYFKDDKKVEVPAFSGGAGK